MSTVLKILRINTYLQSMHGTLHLEGRSVFCVALDGTVTFKDSDDGNDGMLTDAQVDDLFQQTMKPVEGK